MSGDLLKRVFAFFLCLVLFTSSVSASVTIHFSEDKNVTVRKKEAVSSSGEESAHSDRETEDQTEADPEYPSSIEETVDEDQTESENMYTGVETEPDTENTCEETEADIYMPAQKFSAKTESVSVVINAPEGAFPEGTSMSVWDVEDQETISTIEEAVSAHVSRIHAVDITFFDKEGRKLEPFVPVSVIMTAEEKKEDEEALVIHVDDKGKAEEITSSEINPEEVEKAAATAIEISNGAAEGRSLENNSNIEQETAQDIGADQNIAADSGVEAETKVERVSLKSKRKTMSLMASAPEEMETEVSVPVVGESVQFTTDHFSVYALVYTVDFEYSVNGKMYQFSLPGGGFVSFTDLVEVLGIIGDTNSEGNGDETESEIVENAEENAANDVVEENSVNFDTNTALTLGDVEVSEATRKFVSDVASVEFSTPSLVDVSKVEADTTVGQIKEGRGLECEYSAELTEEQIAEINAQTVEAGDWALISVQPFTSEETLTVTMKDGEVFTIRVTDYQISTNVLTADGKTYKITVTFDDDAEIPAGTKLTAEEIRPGTDAYLQHLGKSWAEVNKEYLEQEEEKRNNIGGLDEYEDIRPVNLDDARFFNISLIYNQEEVEPKAPVQIDIRYVDGLETNVAVEEAVFGAVHFIDDTDDNDVEDGEVELIHKVDTVCDEDGKYVEFTYEQYGFSDIGTYVGQKTYDNVPYVMNASLAMPLLKALANTTETPHLDDIEAHKSLSNNHDGTYTMSLTVKGDSKAYEEYNKANILFVMDRSSSMTNSGNDIYTLYTGEYQSGSTYYGKNGNSYFALAYSDGKYYTLNNMGQPQYWNEYTGDRYTRHSRLQAEQAAMDVLIQNLLGKNDADTPGKEDLIEISVISFADQRMSGDTEYTGWTSTDYSGLMSAINQTNTPSGTNWEDALIYAKQQADSKKNAQPDEDVYVIFLTDGEPTAVWGESGGARHYNNVDGGFEYALTEAGGPYNNHGRTEDGLNSMDRAKQIVDGGHKLYGIFTFNPGEAQTRYLRRLMNYAYTGVDKAYLNDDVVAIDNEPPIPETVDIGVTKTWTNDNGDISKRKDITVRLFADGVPYADWTDKNGAHLKARDDTVKVLPIKADGTTDGYTWTGLPGGPVYSVVEDGVAGYTTTYSPKSSQVSNTINIKNKYIPGKTFIHVEKNWSSDIAQENRAEDITVQLKRKVSANAEIRVVRNNGQMIEHFSVPVGSSITIGYDGKPGIQHEYYFENGDVPKSELYTGNSTNSDALIGSVTNSSVGDTISHQIRYVIENVEANGYTLRFPEDYGQTAGSYDPNLQPRFTIAPFVSITGNSGDAFVEDTDFNNENRYYTISSSNGWKIDIDRLVKEDADGKYIYYIEEVGVNDNTETPEEAGYTVTYENNDGIEGGTGNAAQDTIKVTNSPEPGALKVTKTVSGTDAKGTYSIAVKGPDGHYYGLNGADRGTNPFYVTFSRDETKTWRNLPAGPYTVEEQDASETGYTWHVTGIGQVEVPVGGTAEAEVTNAYEELPETGSLKITKIAKIGTEEASTLADSRKSLADGTYTFNVYTDSSATTLATKADGSPVGDVTVVIHNGVAESAAEVEGLTGGKYYVKETSGTNPAVTLDTNTYEVTVEAGKTGDDVESSATATATNTLPVGSLNVTKTILRTGPGGGPGNQFPPEGTYTYSVTITTVIGGQTYYVQDVNGTLGTSAPETPLTVTAGATAGQPSSALTIRNLPYGTYTVTEVNPESVDVPNYSYIIVTGENSPSVFSGSASVGETEGSVALRNYYMRGTSWTPEVRKLLNGEAYTENASGYTGYTFVLSEDREKNPGQNTIKDRPGQNNNHTLTVETNDQGIAVFDMIEYHHPDSGKEFYYTITEQRPTAAQEDPYIADNVKYDVKTIYVKVSVTREGHGPEEVMKVEHHYYSDSDYQTELTNFSPTFDNTELGTLTVQKTVQGSYSATDTDEFPFTVKIGEQYVTGTLSGTTYTYSGLSDTDPGYKIKPGETNKITFINLPVGTYVVTEGDADRTGYNVTTTYKVSGSNAQDGTAEIQKGKETPIEITNSYSNVTLDVIKVEKNNSAKTLPGAKFMITLLDDEQTTAGRVTAKAADEKPVYQVESSTTGSDGKVSFAGLTDGYYMIEETKTPDGYVSAPGMAQF